MHKHKTKQRKNGVQRELYFQGVKIFLQNFESNASILIQYCYLDRRAASECPIFTKIQIQSKYIHLNIT